MTVNEKKLFNKIIKTEKVASNNNDTMYWG